MCRYDFFSLHFKLQIVIENKKRTEWNEQQPKQRPMEKEMFFAFYMMKQPMRDLYIKLGGAKVFDVRISIGE